MARHLRRAEDDWASIEHFLSTTEPTLRLTKSTDGSWARIIGQLRYEVGNGEIQCYALRIEYPNGNPRRVPDVYSDDVPSTEDNHVEPDHRFCLWLPVLAPTHKFHDPADGLAYLLRRTREFIGLQRQYFTRRKFNIEPHWQGPEWAHGNAGYLQWARETAAGLSRAQATALTRWAHNPPSSRTSRCACRSGKSYKDCHKGWVESLRAALRDPAAKAAWATVRKELT